MKQEKIRSFLEYENEMGGEKMDCSNQIILKDMKDLEERNLPLEKLKNTSILITGASGMLAAYLVHFFMYLNETKKYEIRVIALVRNEKKAWSKFEKYHNDKNFILKVQDVCVPFEIDEPLDYIIHAAGNASPYFILNDPTGIIAANTSGTVNVLEIARKNGVKKVLYTSTREVYGKMPEGTTEIFEDTFGSLDPTEIRACYPESKRMAETLFQSYSYQYHVPFTTVRIAHSYGPGMIIDDDGRVMADFISDIVHGRNIVLKSTGDAERAFCYITDAVAGMLFALLKGDNGEAYNIANEKEPLPIREVATLLTELYPEKGLKVVFDIPESMSAGYSKMGRVRLNTEKLESKGWNCRVSLREGLIRTIESFK